MATAMTERKNGKELSIKEMLMTDAAKKQFAAAMPKHCSPDRMARVALTALSKTPKLAQCTPESFFECMISLSQWGLEPDGRRAHLIPYGNKCTLIIDYKGLVELAYRSGQVAKIHADIVCENDIFEENKGEVLVHRIDRKKDRGPMYAAYAEVRLINGATACVVMSKKEIDAIKAQSRSGSSGPWVTHYDEQAKKTAFRRLTKWLPLSAEVMDATYGDDDTPVTIDTATFKSPAKSLDNLADQLAIGSDQGADDSDDLEREAYERERAEAGELFEKGHQLGD